MNLNEPKIEPRLLDDLKARGLLRPATALLQAPTKGTGAPVVVDGMSQSAAAWLAAFDSDPREARRSETIDEDGVITIKSAPGGEVGHRLQTDFARMFGGKS